MVSTVAIFRTNFTKSKGVAKAHIRYIQHRPGRTQPGKTEGNHMTHSHCCELAENSNPEHLWYYKTYHSLTCETLSSDYWLKYYTGGWSSPYKTRNKVPQKDTLVNKEAASGDSKAGTTLGKETERLTRTLFGIDGAMDRQDAYRMVDAAENGSSYFRIKISPDPKNEDTKRDLHLRDVTEQTMQTLEERVHKPVHWVAAEHDDHTPIRHVHVLAVVKGRLSPYDLQAVRQRTTEACLQQRAELDLMQEKRERQREEAAWEHSH